MLIDYINCPKCNAINHKNSNICFQCNFSLATPIPIVNNPVNRSNDHLMSKLLRIFSFLFFVSVIFHTIIFLVSCFAVLLALVIGAGVDATKSITTSHVFIVLGILLIFAFAIIYCWQFFRNSDGKLIPMVILAIINTIISLRIGYIVTKGILENHMSLLFLIAALVGPFINIVFLLTLFKVRRY